MTMYLMTPQEHAQIVDALTQWTTPNWAGSGVDQCNAALSMLKAMKPAKPKGWVTQAGTVTGAIAGDGSAHDGELYGWKPLYAKEQQ